MKVNVVVVLVIALAMFYAWAHPSPGRSGLTEFLFGTSLTGIIFMALGGLLLMLPIPVPQFKLIAFIIMGIGAVMTFSSTGALTEKLKGWLTQYWYVVVGLGALVLYYLLNPKAPQPVVIVGGR